MRLTTRGRYAVTAMLDLGLHDHGAPVPLADIARRQDISLAYLEQLFARLRRGGLVCSTRGPGGGYQLARAPAGIAVADVIEAVDENVDYTRCGGSADCQRKARCLTHGLWAELSDQIQEFLAGVSLADIMSRQTVQEVAARQDRSLAEQRVDFAPTLALDRRRSTQGVVS